MSPVLRECGAIYRGLISAGISPLEADRMELWQIAELFDTAGSKPMTHEEIEEKMIRERVKAMREGRDPDVESLMPGMTDADIAGFGDTTAPPLS